MGKKASKKQASGSSREVRMQIRISKAREALQRIQEKRTYVVRKGEDDVEKARASASKRLAAVTSRLEKKAAILARAEDRLRAAQSRRLAAHSTVVMPQSPTPVVGINAGDQPHTGITPTIILPDSPAAAPGSHEQNSPLPESDGAHS